LSEYHSHSRTVSRLLPFLFYMLVTLLLIGPGVSAFGVSVVGWDGKDQPEYVWSLWQSTEALLHGQNPASMQTLNYPDEYFHEIRWATLTAYLTAIPFAWLPSRVLYNVLVVLGSAATGYTTYLLALDISGRHGPALLSGLVMLLFPSRWAHVLGGHFETAQTYWYPLALLMLRHLLLKPTLKRAVLNSVVWALAVMNSLPGTAYVLMPLALAYGLFGLCHGVRDHRGGPVLRGLLLSAGIGMMLLAPFVTPLARELLREATWLVEGGDADFSVDLVSLIAPPPQAPIWRLVGGSPRIASDAVANHPQETMGYLGIIPCLLGLVAIGKRRSQPELVVFGVVAVGAAVLALGPVLRFGGEVVIVGLTSSTNSPVTLPYALLSALPGFSVGRTPARFLLLAGLMLSQLAAVGCTSLLQRLGPHRLSQTLVLGLLMIALTLGNVVVWPAPMYELADSAAISELAAQADGGVLNIPVFERQAGQEGLFHQITHGHPIIGGYVHRSLSTSPGREELIDWATRPSTGGELVPEPSAPVAWSVLQAADVRYLVLHKHYAEDSPRWEATLTQRFGRALISDGYVAIFRVPDHATVQELTFADRPGPWEDTTALHGRSARWLSDEGLKLGLYAPKASRVDLVFSATALDRARHLLVTLNGHQVGQVVVGPSAIYRVPGLDLEAGFNNVSLHDLNGCTPVTGDARCMISQAFLDRSTECDPWNTIDQCANVLVQDIQISAHDAALQTSVGSVSLLAARYPTCNLPGDSVSVDWTWRVDSRLTVEPHAFVHLVADDGTLVVQDDRVPYLPWYRYTDWNSGDMMSDTFFLQLPADLATGDYRLLMGIYSYPDLTRWPVAGLKALPEISAVELGVLQIEASCQSRE